MSDDNGISKILWATMGMAICAGLSLMPEGAASRDATLNVGTANGNAETSDGDAYSIAAESGARAVRKSGPPDAEDIAAALPSVAMVILGLILLYRLARFARIQTNEKKGDSDKWL